MDTNYQTLKEFLDGLKSGDISKDDLLIDIDDTVVVWDKRTRNNDVPDIFYMGQNPSIVLWELLEYLGIELVE